MKQAGAKHYIEFDFTYMIYPEKANLWAETISMISSDIRELKEVDIVWVDLCRSGDNINEAERSEERRVGKECRSRWSPYH